ncbi:ABC transporter permease [Agromyces atrinae]|uniref:ABC transporter permease n=1 Tax=Agromyces atrinae TaxID=592376 RepID=A0A4Q2MBE9_9MICO|nr:ABC transporter permease [Agromyces atrinae]NYD68056.1 NitT/TauT family transport system permease protein [Agromyces atrinae]RXZ87793.1 ABC transporter permease [Agromyces atrinae]
MTQTAIPPVAALPPVRLAPGGHVVRALAPALGFGVVFIVLWELVVQVGGVQSYLLPAPSAILAALVQSAPAILSAAQVTALAVVLSVIFGGIAGILAAFVVALFEGVAQVMLGLVAVLSCAPIVALAPIFNAWFGSTNLTSKVAVAGIMVFFPVMVNTTRGLLAVDPLHRELMQSLSGSRVQLMIWFRVPGAVPSLFDGLRIGATLSVIGVIVSEYFGGTTNALGVYIANTAALSKFADTWAGVVVASLLGLAIYGAVTLLERIVAPWRFAARS